MPRFFVVVVFLVVLPGCQSLFFWPAKELVNSPKEFNFSREIVFIENNKEIKLHGWYLTARSSSSTPQGTVYVLHGNAGNLSYHIANFYWLIDHGWNVFILDYQGFGRSEGTPTFAGIIDDATVGYKWLREKQGKGERLLVLGQSLGGAAAIGLAATVDESPDGLIIDSTFASHRQIFQETLAKSWLLWPLQWPLSLTIDDAYAPQKMIEQVSNTPMLLIHSSSDRLISLDHARVLYSRASAPKMLWIDDESEHAQMWQRDGWKEKLACQLKRWPQLQKPTEVCSALR